MNKYEIETQFLVYPKKSRLILNHIFNIFLISYSLVLLFTSIMDGDGFHNFGYFFIPLLVVSYFKTSKLPKFHRATLSLEIMEDKIIFNYYNIEKRKDIKNAKYELFTANIEQLEHHKQYDTLVFKGKIDGILGNKKETRNELVIYCKKDYPNIINSLKQILYKDVVFFEGV